MAKQSYGKNKIATAKKIKIKNSHDKIKKSRENKKATAK